MSSELRRYPAPIVSVPARECAEEVPGYTPECTAVFCEAPGCVVENPEIFSSIQANESYVLY